MTLIELIAASRRTRVLDACHERRLERIFATLGPRIGRQNDYRDFRVLELVDWPRDGLRTFVTKGVSGFLLQQESGYPAMRQELAVTIASETNGEGVPAFLATIARSLIEVGRALPEKEIVWSTIADHMDFPGCQLVATYPAYCVWLPKEFSFQAEQGGFPFATIELIPVTNADVRLISTDPGEFERLTQQGIIDLLDLGRS